MFNEMICNLIIIIHEMAHQSRYFIDLRYDKANERCFQKARLLITVFQAATKVTYAQPHFATVASKTHHIRESTLQPNFMTSRGSRFEILSVSKMARWLSLNVKVKFWSLVKRRCHFSRFPAGFKDAHAGISSS